MKPLVITLVLSLLLSVTALSLWGARRRQEQSAGEPFPLDPDAPILVQARGEVSYVP